MVFNKAEYMKEYQFKNKLRIKTRRAKHRIDNLEITNKWIKIGI